MDDIESWRRIEAWSMFGAIESKKWWAQVQFSLFGTCSHFLDSNIFTVHLILKWPKLRPTYTCFWWVSDTVQKTGGNFAIFCTN